LQQEINGDWIPIARRQYVNTDDWITLDPAGKVVMRGRVNNSERLREPKEFPGVNGVTRERKTREEEMLERVRPPPGSNPPRGTARQREEERKRGEGK
jgi:hypothetical protein